MSTVASPVVTAPVVPRRAIPARLETLSSQYLPRERRRFTDLVRTEAHKLVDSRTSQVLLAVGVVVALLAVAANLVFAALARSMDPTFEPTVGVTDLVLSPSGMLGLFVGLLGILSVTGEWSHRTTLTTFTLEPRRGRVLLAKAAVLTLVTTALVAVMIPIAYGVAGIAAAIALPVTWALSWSVLGGLWLTTLSSLLMGLGLGLLTMSAPAAIVAWFVVPTALNILSGVAGLWQPLVTVMPWLDPNAAAMPLLDAATPMTGPGWAHLAVGTLVWVGLPLALGTLRWLRREVK